jgi:hypothetical protein
MDLKPEDIKKLLHQFKAVNPRLQTENCIILKNKAKLQVSNCSLG